MKKISESFEEGRLEYYKKYGKYPNYAYINKDTVKTLLENFVDMSQYSVFKSISSKGVVVNVKLEPPYNMFSGVILNPIESWVQPNLVYFSMEDKNE